jgi:LysM repeat protein
MEGGSLPWKTQVIINNSPTIESYGKPLPPPPSGFYWEKKADDSWELLVVANSSPNSGLKTTVENPSVVEHTVMPSDTLQGICLRYRVTPVELRRVNMFSGNSIQLMKTLKIPLAAGVQFESQLDGEDVTIRRFANLTNEGQSESKIYLEENGWDLDKAYAQWKVDEKWEGQFYINKVQQEINNMQAKSIAPSEVVLLDDAEGSIEMSLRTYEDAADEQPLLSR